MKKAHLLRYRSDVKPWVNSSGASVDFTEFVETRGPRGGRTAIHGFALHSTLNLTDATAVIQGEDLYRAFRTLTVEQKDGTRRYNEITGDALRLISYAHNGCDQTKEHADFAISTGNVNISAYVPMVKRFAYEPADFAMAAELLKTVKIGLAQGTDMSQGTSVVTINSGTYWVIAECYEEMSIIQHSIDEWVQRDFDSTLQTKIVTDGRLHDLYLYVRGANGGQTLANLTEAWVEHLMPQSLLKDPDLTTMYERRRESATNLFSTKGNPVRSDPFVFSSVAGTLRAVAVMLTTGTKAYEGPVRDTVLIKTTQSAALPGNLTAIARIIRPRSERVRSALMNRYGVGAGYVKTQGKTKRDPAGWQDEHAAYLPEKFLKK